jgi:DNA-directed RNA polymerase specialized sigma24 family protein
MGAALTPETFTKLLASLDADRERAGEKYEDLRSTLIRFFEWRSAPFPEEHADEALNRVARKLGEGVEVRNIGGYCYEVARLVFLEAMKGHDSKRTSLDSIAFEVAGAVEVAETSEKELRLTCLDDCLRALPRASADLIVEYYRYENNTQIERRQALATELGLRRDALANRVQRLRDKLEQCVTGCLKKESTI